MKGTFVHMMNQMTSLIQLNLSVQFAEQPSPQTSGRKSRTGKKCAVSQSQRKSVFNIFFCLFVGVLWVFEGELGVTPAKTSQLH